MTVSPTVLDVSRAIDELNQYGGEYSQVHLVASNLAFQFARQGMREQVTARDVRYALVAHGANCITISMFAKRIAAMVHFDAFKRLFSVWNTAQKGGYTSDDERIRALEKVVPQ